MQSMFGLLSSSQIYGLQQAHEHNNNSNNNSNANVNKTQHNSHNNSKHRRSSSCLSDSGKESKFFATLNSMQGSIKSPTNFIEKFLRTELLNGYDTIKNYKNFQHFNSSNCSASGTAQNNTSAAGATNSHSAHPEGILTSFNCLQGSYRSNCDGEFYESVNVVTTKAETEADMTIKYSKNLLANPPDEQAPATLQNYQKLPEYEQELTLLPSSGASSGEFNSDNNIASTPVGNLYKRLSFGGRGLKNTDAVSNELVSDYSSSTNSTNSSTTTNTTTKSSTSSSAASVNQKNNNNSNSNSTTSTLSPKSHDLQRTSSASSSGDCSTARERKKPLLGAMSQQRHAFKEASSHTPPANSNISNENINITAAKPAAAYLTPERAQRRKLIQLISHYDQQNKLLQRELAKEKRRRSEELACVAKSLLCFESKLKRDMKSVNQRLLEKDAEICRLVRQNRALRKRLAKEGAAQEAARDVRDEGVVEDGEAELCELERKRGADEQQLMEDCLVLEALQCINCRKQFYDIDLKEGWTQTTTKDGSRNNDDHTTEHGSSSDDTVSSSFYGARRSVRYTSKRTSGTFRDYMRSRSMNIDDPALEQNSEENTSTISRDDSQASYEKMNIYSRTIERMHGVKCESERESEQSGQENIRSVSRLSNKSAMSSSNNSKNKANEKSSASQIEEDDGIFSPTQDDDFEEADLGDGGRSIKIVLRRSTEFSEASPKQVYETSTDDWYASASDPEEIGGSRASTKLYAQGAVNPVLECVNQILLQQSMEESLHESAGTSLEGSASSGSEIAQQQLMPKSPNHLQVHAANLPRRSSLSGRRSSRSNSHSSDGQPSRNGTLTRKRVHFSTKNSMVHVPRNDDHDHDEDASGNEVISTPQQYHPMNYFPAVVQQQQQQQSPNGSSSATAMLSEVSEEARLETLNYESIYSNEYEPIGSEHNSSNLYVDMESTVKLANSSATTPLEAKMSKMPPALPPKPANLLKFKKSLHQLDEVPDEHLHQDNAAYTDSANNDVVAASEPDYCSISEVNVGITSVQIVADVHKVPESEADPESQHSLEAPVSEFDVEMATVASDDTCAASQKTDEIEEIFADIPKLPNVAAIIAPKHPKYQQEQQSNYLIMSPKAETLQQTRNAALLSTSGVGRKSTKDLLSTPTNSKQASVMPLKLTRLLATPTQQPQQQQQQQQQYKRKHMPNILAEINKRMSQPSSPTTPSKLALTPTKPHKQSSNGLLKTLEHSTANLPLQAEFDWYNLDAEYGKAPLQQPDLLKASEVLNTGNMLAEIHEDHESVGATADEYNLDEEFSLACDKPDVLNNDNESEATTADMGAEVQRVPIIIEPLRTTSKLETNAALNAAICEAVNFTVFSESSPLASTVTVVSQPHNVKAKKMKKNLANFEKFIEGSGLSTKPLPSKRKIYFAGPFV